MKKVMILILSVGVILGLVGCGNKEVSSQNKPNAEQTQVADNNASISKDETKKGDSAKAEDKTSNSEKKIEADPVILQALKEEEDFINSHPDGYSYDEFTDEFIKTHPSRLYDIYLMNKYKGDLDTIEESREFITPTSIKYIVDVNAANVKERHELILELQSDKTFKITSDKVIK